MKPELAAEIRRLHQVEGWRKHTIARHVGVHHSTVSRVLLGSGLLTRPVRRRTSMMDRFVPFIEETLERYPDLAASVLHEMACKRGYPGGADNFRHRIRALGLRPRKAPEAFLSLRTLAGEQCQVDWGHFGHRKVDGGMRKLYAFVMVLSYSRSIFFRFYYDARTPSFLDAARARLRFLRWSREDQPLRQSQERGHRASGPGGGLQSSVSRVC